LLAICQIAAPVQRDVDGIRRGAASKSTADGLDSNCARNLTAVDDKTIRRAREEGRPLREITRELIEKFREDCDDLNCLRPHEEPTATGHIADQIAMIDRLIEKGHAYAVANQCVIV
jgi:cysteinyl-tRNA synthetase